MAYKFERLERDYSAKEAAELTDVGQVMQRDWRRHGFLKPSIPGKRVRFSLLEICILALMKVQIDGGKSASAANWVAKMSALAARTQVELWPGNVAIQGVKLSSSEKRKLVHELNEAEDAEESVTRYIFLPSTGLHVDSPLADGEPSPTAYHFASLAEMERNVMPNWVHGSIFDLRSFAASISFKTKEPLVTYRMLEGNS